MLGLDDIFRFWSYVNKTPDCWIWVGGFIGSGPYSKDGRQSPCFTIKGVNFVASRIMWLIEYKKDPGDLMVLHECDNRSCVRPDHLWLGTNAENVQDSFLKGRGQKANRRKL